MFVQYGACLETELFIIYGKIMHNAKIKCMQDIYIIANRVREFPRFFKQCADLTPRRDLTVNKVYFEYSVEYCYCY